MNKDNDFNRFWIESYGSSKILTETMWELWSLGWNAVWQ